MVERAFREADEARAAAKAEEEKEEEAEEEKEEEVEEEKVEEAEEEKEEEVEEEKEWEEEETKSAIGRGEESGEEEEEILKNDEAKVRTGEESLLSSLREGEETTAPEKGKGFMQWEHPDPRISFLRPSAAMTFLCGEKLSADQIIRYTKRAHSRALVQPGEYTVRLGGLVAYRWKADGQEDYWCLHQMVDIVLAKKINPVTHLPESTRLPVVAHTEDNEKYSVLVQSFERPAGARGGGDTDGTDFEFCLTT
uniref:Uncharacterized protein n=1 Tax=Chromera velia CCMP2878 TaxID=1169474 RepID=A0A0G4HYN2_9ALVE|eukprot:Cvel_9520.t1-p1 / transcript=Cvel_9520.t1 / gene=Cvel_9520 / organism=Chromera_velia_CCMP2878 / gene_product=hypothetical protein / transcript_product=hypothetical protein / location=Cvel_scaffold551:27636-34062(+) / protein_length=251 / sequence_SO=supercontig / SO=protein_coding / is_pseudo=false